MRDGARRINRVFRSRRRFCRSADAVLALGFTMREASSTSLLVMIIASAAGLMSRIGTSVSIDWGIVIVFALASMIGGLVGAPASRRMREVVLTRLFAGLLFIVATYTMISTLIEMLA